MTKEKILITGGAGFIGTNLARKLIEENYQITIFDNFNPQVHGTNKEMPYYFQQNAEIVIGDVTNVDDFMLY
jgi:dTDP-L-rhamnose 4-epimerase